MIDFDDLDTLQLTNEDWIKIGYICLLQRKIDDVGLQSWCKKVKDGTFHYKDFLDTLMLSPEYLMHYKIPFSTVLHQTRVKWVSSLPYYSTILDIGGSSPNSPLGAMIELGYTHRPHSITIFDLPPEKQYWGKPKYEQRELFSFEWGKIQYVHGYAEKIETYEFFKNKKYDCIFLGQTIEHIEKKAIEDLFRWIFDHISINGRLIFDTPNRRLTGIQFPHKLSDMDHKYEYTPHEMEILLNKYGFEVMNKWGFLHMPETLNNKIFDPLEIYETEKLNHNPEDSYCFAFECGKRLSHK